MNDFINTIDLLGDDVVFGSRIDGSITEFKDNILTQLGEYSFYNCPELATVDVPNVTVIGTNAFTWCKKLNTLVLRSNTLCTLTKDMAQTGIANKTGYIYVPRALLGDDDSTKDYRRATNWSTVASQFRALEDYTVDGTTTGELDETKI